MKKLTIREVEELTGATHEPCDLKDLPFPEEEDKWQQITIDDILKAEENLSFQTTSGKKYKTCVKKEL